MSKTQEALKLALDWINSNAEHDQNCDVLYLDEDDKHLHCSCGLERVITAIREALAEQPAQQQEPLFWYRPCSNGMYEGPIHDAQIESVRKESGAWHPLYTSPPASKPLTDEQKDAARYRWLKARLMGADFDWNESGACALVFEWPEDVPVGVDCDQNIDAAIEAAHGITGEQK